MIPLKIHHPNFPLFVSQITPLRSFLSLPHLLSLPLSPIPHRPRISFKPKPLCSSPSLVPTYNFSKPLRVSKLEAAVFPDEEEDLEHSPRVEDLSPDGPVYQKTLALVECSMLAALTGLVYFLSNSLAIEVR